MGRTWTGLLLLVSALLALPVGAASGATHGLQAFTYEGQEQVFVVPSGVYYLEIAAAGADGGSNGGARSVGGQAAVDVIVHPGQRLYFEVGGVGQDVDAGDGNCQSISGNVECLGTFGGWNGGGNGGPRASRTCSAGQTCQLASSGAGGGGASDVQTMARVVGAAALGSRLLIAGGGGGDGAPGRPGNSFGTGGDGAAAPPAGTSGQAIDGASGSPAVDPSFSVGGQGGGGGGAGGTGGAGGASGQPTNPFGPSFSPGVPGLTSSSKCPPNHYSFTSPDPSAAGMACGGYGGGGNAFAQGSGGTVATQATGGGGGGGGGGYDGGGGGGGGGTHNTNVTGPNQFEGGGGGGGGGGASWVAPAARSLGPVSSALHATQDSSGNGQIVVELQGAFSAFYDGTPRISAARVSGPNSKPTVSVTERCAGAPGTVCRLTTTLRPNGSRLTVTLAGGQQRRLHLRLTRAGRRRLRGGHKLKVTVHVTQRSAAGVTRLVRTEALTLR